MRRHFTQEPLQHADQLQTTGTYDEGGRIFLITKKKYNHVALTHLRILYVINDERGGAR
jgi:hypothetical protein